MTYGKLQPEGRMFLRVNVGKATAPDGTEYEMTVSAGDYSPIVRNLRTDRTFTLSWQDILELAGKAGINAP
jgi:hypothetical protein